MTTLTNDSGFPLTTCGNDDGGGNRKYQAYPEYKDSGVEWLGKIPIHWDCTQIKYGYEVTLGKMLQKEQKVSTDKLRPYLKAINVQPDGVSLINVNEMWFSEADLHSLRLKDGDVLISEGGDVGRAAIWHSELEECYIQNALNRARPKKRNSSRFLYYWMNTLKDSAYIEVICNKATIAHYTAEKVESSPMVLPTEKEEAEIIANFLDHETAKIDTLIEKQQQLIKLLKEKRQAVISHAVTKGLNPDAPMRDSGVEWLGEVPEHWAVCKLKHTIASLESGVSVNAADIPAQSQEMGVLKTSCVYTRHFRVEENKTVLKEEENRVKCPIRKGAIIISRMNTPELVGASALVEEDTPNIYLPDRLWQTVFANNYKQNPKYIAFFMMIKGFRSQISLAAEGASSSMQNIAQPDYLSINIALPEIQEQDSIVIYLKSKLNSLRTLEEKANRAIELMQERRTALISAAVTGKIDVRNFKVEDSHAA